MQNEQPKSKKSKGFEKMGNAVLRGHPRAEIYKKAFNKYKVISGWNQAVGQFFDNAEGLTKAMDFKDGLLVIACLTKELASKIKMFAERIIYILNSILGKELVFALRVEY